MHSRRSAQQSRSIPLFSLRLGRGRVIGRAALRQLWERACNSSDVQVRGTPIDPVHGIGFIYTLSASEDIADLAGVEQRMRALVAEHMPSSPVTLLRLA